MSYLFYSHLGPAAALRVRFRPQCSYLPWGSTSQGLLTSRLGTAWSIFFFVQGISLVTQSNPASDPNGSWSHLPGDYCLLLPPNPPSHQASALCDFLERNKDWEIRRELALFTGIDEKLT